MLQKGKRSAIQLVKEKRKKKKTINIQKVQATPSREGGMVGRRWSHGGATAMHCPAIKQLPRGPTGDGSWGGVRSAAAILDGPADVGDSADGVLSQPT